MNKERLVIITIVVLVIAALSWTVYSAFYGQNYKKAIAAENSNDICKAPDGYTQEDWNTHMSHHPDTYKQCLN